MGGGDARGQDVRVGRTEDERRAALHGGRESRTGTGVAVQVVGVVDDEDARLLAERSVDSPGVTAPGVEPRGASPHRRGALGQDKVVAFDRVVADQFANADRVRISGQ